MSTPHLQTTLRGRVAAVGAGFDLKDQIKALPGARWNASARCWTVPAEPGIVVQLVEVCDPCTMSDEVSWLLDQGLKTQEAVLKINSGEDLKEIPNTKTQPWEHQKHAFWFAVARFGDEV